MSTPNAARGARFTLLAMFVILVGGAVLGGSPTGLYSMVLGALFGASTGTVVPHPAPTSQGASDYAPSAGAAGCSGNPVAVWTREDPGGGMILQVGNDAPVFLATCGGATPCFKEQWAPCVAVRSDGRFALVWANAENPNYGLTSFDIALRVFDADGSSLASPVIVADTAGIDERSPAVAFDDTGAIIVTWVEESTCPDDRPFRIGAKGYAFAWDDVAGVGEVNATTPRLLVDGAYYSDDWHPLELGDAHPSVAISRSADPDFAGRFVVCWNAARQPNDTEIGVRASVLQAGGVTIGPEFRVNQVSGLGMDARLSRSAQHAVAYSPLEEIVVTWTLASAADPSLDGVYLTRLPADYPDSMPIPFEPGDINFDGEVNGLDIQSMMDTIADDPCAPPQRMLASDLHGNGTVDSRDTAALPALLVGGPLALEAALEDCDGNGNPDSYDLKLGLASDCNKNFVLDACDIAGGISLDIDGNGVPDECQIDCDKNGEPDSWQIAQGYAFDCNQDGIPDHCQIDCNGNGIPDDCDLDPTDPDGDGFYSMDCDANGMPDECDPDCNLNDIPDACDIASGTSQDCNENGIPDTCDLSRKLANSEDCNENGIPDECDIANGTSLDCNVNLLPDECEIDKDSAAPGGPYYCWPTLFTCDPDCNDNGIPDKCDIASGTSQDVDMNSIPDECAASAQQPGYGMADADLMGGGTLTDAQANQPTPGGYSNNVVGPPLTEEEAWEAFYNWAFEQDWTGQSWSDRFRLTANKLEELGLPLNNPWGVAHAEEEEQP